jgi:hypothetical protein
MRMNERLRPGRLEIDLTGCKNGKRRFSRGVLYGVAGVCAVMLVLLPRAVGVWVVAGAYWMLALATFAVAIAIPRGEVRMWKMPAH